MSESLEEFYSQLLGINSPWEVTAINRDSTYREVTAIVRLKDDCKLFCPVCGQEAMNHDHRVRRWRHLDSCNHKTLIEGTIPRVKCSEHGVKQIRV